MKIEIEIKDTSNWDKPIDEKELIKDIKDDLETYLGEISVKIIEL